MEKVRKTNKKYQGAKETCVVRQVKKENIKYKQGNINATHKLFYISVKIKIVWLT